jgi:hypothetical protein
VANVSEQFLRAFNAIEAFVEKTYGMPVVITDVPAPFTGDLDGASIKVDYENSPEDALFIIAHLFGHTVQWNLTEEGRTIGNQIPDPNLSAERIQALYDYELSAARYSLALFHQAGIHDLDQWLADYFNCDWAYLSHFYKHNEKREFRSFWKAYCALIEPLAIPEFHPTVLKTR